VRADMAAGHSYGEFAALCAAGVYDEASLLELSEIRASAIVAAAGTDPGAMAAAGLSARRIPVACAFTARLSPGPPRR
jgi:malonyl CoA-acyl carrier protein transacylase